MGSDSPTKDEIWDAWVDHAIKLDFTARPVWNVMIHRPLKTIKDLSYTDIVNEAVPVVTFKRTLERVWRGGNTFIREDIRGNGELVSRKYWIEFDWNRWRAVTGADIPRRYVEVQST
jgi:hypothetical protein